MMRTEEMLVAAVASVLALAICLSLAASAVSFSPGVGPVTFAATGQIDHT